MKRLMLLVVSALAMLLVAVMISPQAVAAPIVFENFNYGDGTAIHGQTPTNAEWKVTVAGLAPPGGTNLDGPRVFDDPGGDVAGRGQALLASQANDPPDPGAARLVLDNPIAQDFTLSFDYNTNTNVSRTLNLLMGDNPSGNGSESIEGGQIIFGKRSGAGEGAFIRYRQPNPNLLGGNINNEAAFAWPENDWMEVVLDIQPSARTYQMSIDSGSGPVSVFTDGGWGTNGLDEVQVFAMERSGSTRTSYVDNLIVDIPEPASAVLALLAVSLLLGRGWSRRRD